MNIGLNKININIKKNTSVLIYLDDIQGIMESIKNDDLVKLVKILSNLGIPYKIN